MKMMMDRLSLEFPKRIGGFLDETARYSVLCLSPKRTEFRFCAFLSAWESTALNDAKATHWLQVWQKECRKRHRELGKTLADPASGIPVPKGHVSQREISKAYKVVLDGLRRVFRGTLSHYSLEESEFPSSHGAPRVLFQNIGISFKTAKQFACPEGLEMFLLTLVEEFEQSLGIERASLVSRNLWLAEIRRRRLGGQPETRTLADVAPAEVRLQRQNAFPQEKRLDILRHMLPAMRRIVKKCESFLAKQALQGVGNSTSFVVPRFHAGSLRRP